MKYLKLFEDHKETSDKIDEIEKNAQNQKEEVINGYKSLIDEMMYDITDDYETESVISIKYDSILDCKTYLDYKDVLSKLLEVVRILKDAHDISYNIRGIWDMDATTLVKLPGRINYYINPFDFVEAKKIVKNHIDINSRTNPSDIKLAIFISF